MHPSTEYQDAVYRVIDFIDLTLFSELGVAWHWNIAYMSRHRLFEHSRLDLLKSSAYFKIDAFLLSQ
jgi:hypothetical protein